ncbi:hypothetical protein T484DRAFT_2028043 [Baffinella frigidus]|nr:hypothetical protein T484DRAFT_2028043 [Cryptophyta sp. CCMP2293]
MEDIVEAPIETPIKIKKPRSEKHIEAFQKAIAKKAELSLINKEFNQAKKQQREEVVEHKKRIIKAVKEPEPEVEVEVEVEPKLKRKSKKKIPVPVESESESESEEEEIIVKRKAKPKQKNPVKKIIYEDTSSEESEDEAAIVNMAKVIKKTARERLKEELNQAKMNSAMSSLGYI